MVVAEGLVDSAGVVLAAVVHPEAGNGERAHVSYGNPNALNQRRRHQRLDGCNKRKITGEQSR